MDLNTMINLFFILIFALVAGLYFMHCWSPCRKLNENIKVTISELKQFGENEYNFKYHDIDKIISNNEDLYDGWNEYKKTLTKITLDNTTMLYSTQAVSDYLNFNTVTKSINITLWQNLGGIFTGIGILGTFAGLVLGLKGINVSAADVDVLKVGISNLLNGISTAFFTSLIGICLALLFNIIHNKCNINKLNSTVGVFIRLLEEMYPRKTQELWLAETVALNKKQTETLENFSADLAIALGDQLDQKLNPGFDRLAKDLAKIMQDNLTPILQGVKESLDNLNNGGVKAIGEGINDGVGNELRGFANTLVDLQNNMKESFAATQKTGENANEKLTSMVDELAAKIAQGSQDALTAHKEQIEKMAVQMQAVTDNMSKSAVDSGEKLSQAIAEVTAVLKGTMDDAAEKQNNTLTATCEQIRAVLAEVNENLIKVANDTTKAQTTQVEATVAQMDDIMKNMREAATSSNTEMTKAIAEVSTLMKETMDSAAIKQKNTLEETCEQIKMALNEVNTNLKQATDRMVEASANANTALIKTVDIVKDKAEDTVNTYVQSAEKQAEAMDSASVAMKQNLSVTIDKLRELLEGHDCAMTKAYTEFGDITKKASEIVTEAGASAEKFAAAAVPVTQATNGLKEQMVEVVKANNNFNEAIIKQNVALADTARMNNDTLNKYLKSLESTQKQWHAYEEHFAGVSGELQQTFEVLENGIKNYQTITDTNLKNNLANYDNSMNNAINMLSDRISELNEMTEALLDSAKALKIRSRV